VSFFTWCDVCRYIIVGLPSVIDCLCFFFLFYLLTTKVDNYYLFVCCLLGYGKHVPDPSYLSLGTTQDLRFLNMTTMFGVRPGHGLTTMYGGRPRRMSLVWLPEKRRRSNMVARTRRGSVNAFRSRHGSVWSNMTTRFNWFRFDMITRVKSLKFFLYFFIFIKKQYWFIVERVNIIIWSFTGWPIWLVLQMNGPPQDSHLIYYFSTASQPYPSASV